MTEVCNRTFDDMMLSGYVDGELTQADEQRIRLHLEQCPPCRGLVSELQQIRQAAMSTPFPAPTDEEWQEWPRSAASLWFRRLGWVLVWIWLTGVSGLAMGEFLESSSNWVEKTLLLTLLSGGLLLFLSVLFDRLKSLRTDRYRRVKK